MKVCSVLLVAALVAGVASAGFFAHPLPLLRTPRVYNIIVRSDGSLLPSAAYSLPLDHPIFHTPPAAAPSVAKAAPSASSKDADSDQPAAAPAESGQSESSAPATSSPAPPHLPIVPPPLPITHVAVNFPGAANSSSEHTVVATTLPFYSLYHPLAFPISDPTPFIHPFGPHPGYFFASAYHPPAPAVAQKPSSKSAKKDEGEEKAKDEEEEAERR